MENDKHLYELEETTVVNSNDLLLVEDSETNEDKKVKMSNLISNDVIEQSVDAWLDDHPEATTTVEDGSITPAKLHQDTLDMFDEKANTDGYYDEMSVGSAEQLLSNTYIPDNTPYLFRTSGGSLEIGDRVFEDAIVGGSVAWNQLVNAGTNISSYNINATTFAYDSTNNEYTITLTTVPSSGKRYASTLKVSYDFCINHIYLFATTVTVSKASSINIPYGNSSESVVVDVNSGTTRITGITKLTENKTNILFGLSSAIDYNYEIGDTYKMKDVQCIDLTLMFGSTIADYIYTLEQSEAGSGIAWLKSQGFFTKDYYAYDAGSIKSVQTSAKKVVGFNQVAEIETGSINASGQDVANTHYFRVKGYIKGFPNISYCMFAESPQKISQFYVLEYDNNQSLLTRRQILTTTATTSSAVTFTTSANTHFIRAFVYYENATYSTDNIKMCINLHWDGERDGEYEPYVEHTYPIGNDELRGLFKLSNGKIYADGDVKTSDGVITRKYSAPLDLGTLNWSYNSSAQRFLATLSTKASTWTRLQGICSKYIIKAWGDIQADTTIDKVLACEGSYVTIRDKAYTDAATFKTAMSGQYLVYEKVTPTTETADPYTNPQIVSNWGTEEFVDERDVPVPAGHDSRYLPDLKAKLESAPNNPSVNGKYFLQYENGQATYVPVPSEVPQTPSEDGTYILKATVASGVATLAWVAEE